MTAVDFYALDDLLKPEELEIRDRLREFCAREVTPVASDYWERAEFPFELLPKIAELNLAGGTIEGYGCPGMSWVAAGLVAQEWARSDGSVGTFFGVHSFLAMQTIGMLGSDEQKRSSASSSASRSPRFSSCRTSCRKARSVVADARDILGGAGILLENHVARHFADMEAVFTFEGTDSSR